MYVIAIFTNVISAITVLTQMKATYKVNKFN